MVQTTIIFKYISLVKLNMHALCQPIIIYLHMLAILTEMFLLFCYYKTLYKMSNFTLLNYDGGVAS
jgi:hypothetical protein